MKIVKRNDKLNPPKWHALCTCAHCESGLDVEDEDLKRVQYDDGRGNYIDDAVFKCPVCENWNSIDNHNGDISVYVKNRLQPVKWESTKGGFKVCRVDVAYHDEESE